MSGLEPSKEMPPALAPGYPPTHAYTAVPMSDQGQNPPGPAINMYIPPTAPQYTGNYPPSNTGYPQGQNVMVTLQPVEFRTTGRVQEKDFLVYSIFTMLCCCLPIGIAALVYSINTRDANKRGDGDEAHRNSRTALTLNNVALGLGIVITISWVVYVIYISATMRQFVNDNYRG